MHETLKRRAFIMSVDPAKQDEYEEKMSQVSPALARAMKENGVVNYTIYLDPPSSLLFGHLEYETDEGLLKLTTTEECRQWWKEMSEFMPANPDHSPIASDLKEVFHLD